MFWDAREDSFERHEKNGCAVAVGYTGPRTTDPGCSESSASGSHAGAPCVAPSVGVSYSGGPCSRRSYRTDADPTVPGYNVWGRSLWDLGGSGGNVPHREVPGRSGAERGVSCRDVPDRRVPHRGVHDDSSPSLRDSGFGFHHCRDSSGIVSAPALTRADLSAHQAIGRGVSHCAPSGWVARPTDRAGSRSRDACPGGSAYLRADISHADRVHVGVVDRRQFGIRATGWDRTDSSPPTIDAAGRGEMARAIRRAALRYGVPIVPDKELAEGLWVGRRSRMVPETLFPLLARRLVEHGLV